MEDSALYDDMIVTALPDNYHDNRQLTYEDLQCKYMQVKKDESTLVETVKQLAEENKRLLQKSMEAESRVNELTQLVNILKTNITQITSIARNELRQAQNKLSHYQTTATGGSTSSTITTTNAGGSGGGSGGGGNHRYQPSKQQQQNWSLPDYKQCKDLTIDIGVSNDRNNLLSSLYSEKLNLSMQKCAGQFDDSVIHLDLKQSSFDCRPFNGPKTPPTPHRQNHRNSFTITTDNNSNSSSSTTTTMTTTTTSSNNTNTTNTTALEKDNIQQNVSPTMLSSSSPPPQQQLSSSLPDVLLGLTQSQMLEYLYAHKDKFQHFRTSVNDWLKEQQQKQNIYNSRSSNNNNNANYIRQRQLVEDEKNSVRNDRRNYCSSTSKKLSSSKSSSSLRSENIVDENELKDKKEINVRNSLSSERGAKQFDNELKSTTTTTSSSSRSPSNRRRQPPIGHINASLSSASSSLSSTSLLDKTGLSTKECESGGQQHKQKRKDKKVGLNADDVRLLHAYNAGVRQHRDHISFRPNQSIIGHNKSVNNQITLSGEVDNLIKSRPAAPPPRSSATEVNRYQAEEALRRESIFTQRARERLLKEENPMEMSNCVQEEMPTTTNRHHQHYEENHQKPKEMAAMVVVQRNNMEDNQDEYEDSPPPSKRLCSEDNGLVEQLPDDEVLDYDENMDNEDNYSSEKKESVVDVVDCDDVVVEEIIVQGTTHNQLDNHYCDISDAASLLEEYEEGEISDDDDEEDEEEEIEENKNKTDGKKSENKSHVISSQQVDSQKENFKGINQLKSSRKHDLSHELTNENSRRSKEGRNMLVESVVIASNHRRRDETTERTTRSYRVESKPHLSSVVSTVRSRVIPSSSSPPPPPPPSSTTNHFSNSSYSRDRDREQQQQQRDHFSRRVPSSSSLSRRNKSSKSPPPPPPPAAPHHSSSSSHPLNSSSSSRSFGVKHMVGSTGSRSTHEPGYKSSIKRRLAYSDSKNLPTNSSTSSSHSLYHSRQTLASSSSSSMAVKRYR